MASTSGSASRGGKEPKSTGGLARSAYKAMGGGSVSPEVRAAIAKKMNQGLKPNTQAQPAVSPQSRAESRFPPRSPAVRTTTGTAKPAPKPSIPAPMVSPHPIQQGPAKAPVKRAPDTKVVERVDHSSDSTMRTSGTSIKRSRNASNWRASGLQGEGGVLGGQHMGGHSDVAGGFDEPLGGGASNSFNK
jgi:hypothetical protein